MAETTQSLLGRRMLPPGFCLNCGHHEEGHRPDGSCEYEVSDYGDLDCSCAGLKLCAACEGGPRGPRPTRLRALVTSASHRELLVKLRDVLGPLDAKIDHSLYVGTAEQMRADLSYLRGLLGEAHARIVKEIEA